MLHIEYWQVNFFQVVADIPQNGVARNLAAQLDGSWAQVTEILGFSGKLLLFALNSQILFRKR